MKLAAVVALTTSPPARSTADAAHGPSAPLRTVLMAPFVSTGIWVRDGGCLRWVGLGEGGGGGAVGLGARAGEVVQRGAWGGSVDGRGSAERYL